MKINKLSLLFSKMRIAFILKKTVVKIGFSNFIYNILIILYNEGIIRGFVLIQKIQINCVYF
jgi:ribosomal protein S8